MRYYGPRDAHCNVSKVAFYGQGDQLLKGESIGTPGCYRGDGLHEYPTVFDGKTWTSYDYKDASDGWAGLDFGKPERVTKIVYTPRNRDNYIRPGDQFELFYCRNVWKSLGVIIPESDSLL